MNLVAYGMSGYQSELQDVLARYAQVSSFSNMFRWVTLILSTVGLWNMFIKAGEPGWGAIIPFYRTYLLYKIADMKKAFWVYLIATVGTVIVAVVFVGVAFNSLMSMGHGSGMAFAGSFLFMWLFAVAACIALLVLSIMLAIKVAQVFNLSGGWAVGIFFLPFVFYLIIGISKDIRYKNRFAGSQGFNGQGYAQNPYQQNPYQQNPYQQNNYQQNPYGQNPYAQADYQQNNYQQNNYQQNPYGQNPYAQNSQTQDPYAQNNYSQTTYAQNAYDQNVNQQNVNPYANPSKEEAWKTIYDDQSNNLNQ